MGTIPKDEVCRMICKYCIKVNEFCQHRWDCPLLTEIAKYEDEPQTKFPCDTCANKGDHDGECRNCVADSEVIRWKKPSHYEAKDEPQTERSVCDTCFWYNRGIPCGIEPSVCKREVEDEPQT